MLILHQFMTTDGKIIDREVTGLCERQHRRMDKLIRMSQKAGLMPREQDIYREEKENPEEPWHKNNAYYIEDTIDKQWHLAAKKKKRASFYK